MPKKNYKLIREIKEIINNPDLHFWIKCKEVVRIKTYGRQGVRKGEGMIRDFFKTCAGKYKDRFESAYVRPYYERWKNRDAYDYVNNAYLNEDLSAKIGRNPRGIKFVPTHSHVRRAYESSVRFSRYLKRKYPEAFETFEEIKKVEHPYGSAMERIEDCAWQHIFPRVQERDVLLESETYRGRTTKKAQVKRRKLDLAMKKAQADYKKLEKASKLPPRYLYNEISLAELQNDHKNHTYTIFKKHYYITIDTTLHYDDSDVHHGLGKLTHTDRVLRIRDKDGQRLYKVLKTYSGNFVLNAIEKHFRRKIKKVKVADELKPVQLNPKMDVLEMTKLGSFRTFQRLFCNTHYDYCVLRDGITYHSKTIEGCFIGWEKKKETATVAKKANSKIINMKICTRLGFCPSGVKNFCVQNNLDSHGEYTVGELKAIVSKNLSTNRWNYEHELKQIGIL